MKFPKYLIAVIFSYLVILNSFGQEEPQREVRVVKPYTPTLSDADKISLMPEFNDTVSLSTDFKYSITPKKYSTSFRLDPIKPAKMVGLPLTRLYKSQFTLGLGNYTTPYAELTINQLRDRKNALGLYAKHHSSSGRVKFIDAREEPFRVKAPFSDNDLRLYGRKMFRNSALEGGIGGGYNSWVYYGYNPDSDTLFEVKDNQQRIYTGEANIRFHSTHPDSSHLNYDVKAKYYYLQDAYEFAEHGLGFDFMMGNFVGDWYANVDLNLDLFERTGSFDTTNNHVIKINPEFSKASELWRFTVGLNSALDTKGGQTNLSLYPLARFEFNIVKDVLIPYMGVTGDKKVNTYRSLLEENPFIVPGLIAENEDHQMIGYLGLKGRYSSKMSFDFQAKYSRVSYLNSFVNDSFDQNNRNQFVVVYDDLDLFQAGAEINWNLNEKLNFLLRGDYYDFSQEVYHKPEYEITLNASYNLRDKILVDANLFYTGPRNALIQTGGQDPEMVPLEGFFDGNLTVEYRYTRLLAFFLR
ncbi:MAG: hypothetical protein ACOCWA_01670, partial [Bacteroidota bacterium]